uniref:P-type Cu(+) transporter n=1 Tax=Blastobotrys adeninivorans TaxID=409370 RepID=A0A060T7N4_BLAAD
MARATLSIGGMTCGSCTAAVTSGLEAVNGVSSVAVSLVTERAQVEFDPSVVSPNELVETVEDCGFEGGLIEVAEEQSAETTANATETVTIKVYGMTCTSCTNAVENALRSLDGVESAVVTLGTEQASVVYHPSVIGVRSIIDAIEDAGFDGILASSLDNSQQVQALSRVKEIQQYRKDVLFSLTFSVPVFVISMLVPGLLPFLGFLKTTRLLPGVYLDDVINFALTLPVQFGIGKRFYRNAYKAIRHGAPNMDVLVTISTSCAFFFSCFSVMYAMCSGSDAHPSTLWDTATMLITFVTIGKYLENRAKGQTSVALSRLISLVPGKAAIYTNPKDYDQAIEKNDLSMLQEKVVSTELIQVGDIVILRPGEKVAADGVIVRGSTYVSESHITGESIPVPKNVGDSILGGSVNGTGRVEFKVEHAGDHTRLAHIIRLVQDAQTSRAPVQRLADQLAGHFVPFVLSLAVITFCVWMIVSNVMPNPPAIFKHSSFLVCLRLCISVIVVACPCALGLATPTAVMVGTGVGADHGILIKGGATLETATRINTVLFDKTGTLTKGSMSVTAHETNADTLQFWEGVGALEEASEHPIAAAVMRQARQECGISANEGFEAVVSDFEAFVGEGVSGTVKYSNGKSAKVVAGTPALFTRLGIKGVDDARDANANGESVVMVAMDNIYAGQIRLSDTIKPEAPLAVQSLKKLGLEVGMVTGDNMSAARKIASQVGIPETMVWSNISPSGKIDLVRTLQGTDDDANSQPGPGSRIVAMVGDGVNDSPALAAASVGISMTGSSDVAMETADIVLTREGALLDVPAAIDLSRKTFGRIKLNLLWALLYNVIMIPFAMGLFIPLGITLHPMVAGAAMAMSSVSVVVSSLLLQRWRPPQWMQEGPVDITMETEPIKAQIGPLARLRQSLSGALSLRKNHDYEMIANHD